MIGLVKAGKWIARHRILILIIGILLLVPSVFGIAATKVNYDLLSYLPEDLETVKGQDILVDEYGMGAFSMAMVEGMAPKDVQKLKTFRISWGIISTGSEISTTSSYQSTSLT